MATASANVHIRASADAVWRLVGGFDSLPDWLPYIPSSVLSEGGRVRHLANPSGDRIVERLVRFDEAARLYSYAILEAPFPVRDYEATLQVLGRAPHEAEVRWSGRFTPVGVSEQEATRLFQSIYENGLKALADGFAARAARFKPGPGPDGGPGIP